MHAVFSGCARCEHCGTIDHPSSSFNAHIIGHMYRHPDPTDPVVLPDSREIGRPVSQSDCTDLDTSDSMISTHLHQARFRRTDEIPVRPSTGICSRRHPTLAIPVYCPSLRSEYHVHFHLYPSRKSYQTQQ